MSPSSWTANASLRQQGQRHEERDLHFERAVGENKGDCVFLTSLLSKLQVTWGRFDNYNNCKTVFFLLLKTAIRSFFQRGISDQILLFICTSFAYLLGNLRFFHNIFWFYLSHIYLIDHPSSLWCPSFILSPWTLPGSPPSRSGLPLKKKISLIHLTHSLTFSVCLLFMWMASSVSQAQFWMVTLSL